jgi:hypothetical protein
MTDERKRPVAGEIIAADIAAVERARPAIAADVLDAEFETIRPDPAERLLTSAPIPSIGTVAAPAQGLDRLRKTDAPAGPRVVASGGPIFWIVGLGLAAGAFWVSGGHALVRQSPLMAPASHVEPANPLRIAEVTSKIEDHDGRQILFVDGKAINESGKDQLLPPIEIGVTANDGQVIRYNLGTSSDPLPAGGAFSFSSRFEAPKEGVKSVSVTFQD